MNRSSHRFTLGFFTLFSAPAFSQQPTQHYHDHMWGSGGMFMGSFMFLIIIAAVIIFAIYLFKQTHDSKQTTRQDSSVCESPLEILKIR